MYIQKEDYRTRITSELLKMVTEQDGGLEEDILSDADKFATGIIATYAGVLYDINSEFDKSGADRNYLILGWGVNIAVYILYQRIADEQVPDKVIKNYDDTINDLQALSKGNLPVNLPPVTDSTGSGPATSGDGSITLQNTGLRRMGSRTPRSHIL